MSYMSIEFISFFSFLFLPIPPMFLPLLLKFTGFNCLIVIATNTYTHTLINTVFGDN